MVGCVLLLVLIWSIDGRLLCNMTIRGNIRPLVYRGSDFEWPCICFALGTSCNIECWYFNLNMVYSCVSVYLLPYENDLCHEGCVIMLKFQGCNHPLIQYFHIFSSLFDILDNSINIKQIKRSNLDGDSCTSKTIKCKTLIGRTLKQKLKLNVKTTDNFLEAFSLYYYLSVMPFSSVLLLYPAHARNFWTAPATRTN